jgi:hypothetical protein
MPTAWWNVSPPKRVALLATLFVAVAVIGDHFHILHGQSWFVPLEIATFVLLGVGDASRHRSTTRSQ